MNTDAEYKASPAGGAPVKRRLVFAAAYLAYASVYVVRLNLTVAAPVLETEGILSPAQIGMMSGAFFLLYSLGQLFNGWLGDILPPAWMAAAGLLLAGGSNLMIGLFPGAETAIPLWALNGFGQSMLWGPLLRTVGRLYPPKRKSFVASLLVSSVGVGSVGGIVLAVTAIQKLGVRFAFLLPGIFALAAAGITLPFFRSGSARQSAVPVPLRALFTPKLLILLVPAFCHGILKDGINLWAASYFMETFGVDLAAMSFYVFAIPLLSLAGRLIYPPIYCLFRRREHLVSIACLGLCAVCLLPLCLSGVPIGAAALCLGITAAAVSLVNTSFLTIYPMRYQEAGCVSKVVGLMDFATYMGAGAGSLFYGIWLEGHDYSGMFFTWILLLLPAILLLGIAQRQSD